MGSVDPALCNLAQEYVALDQVVWDVGANVGLFSFASAHLAGKGGKVFAFEPDVWLVQLLRRSASIQPSSSSPVQVVPAAVAGSCGIRTFNIAVRSRATNSLDGYGHGQTGGIAEQQSVVTVSLDWLAEKLPLPNVVKIDVEGAELEVLSGALGLLRKCSPVILCEVCSESSPKVTALLKDAGYRLYDGEVNKAKRREVATAPWSTVAIRT